MPCLSPFKKYIEDLFEAYDGDTSGDTLSQFMDKYAELITEGTPSFGVYPTPEYCCPSCDAIDDPCGNIYFFGSVDRFLALALIKQWFANPASVPCCYNFMGNYKQILNLESRLCWSSVPRCCNDFDNCFKTFEIGVPDDCYRLLMNTGVVEYGTIDDPDNICFLKTYLDERYDDPVKTCNFITQILSVGILIVCPVEDNEVWVLTTEFYAKWCAEL